MTLASSVVTENNYLAWSPSIKITLGAKVKFGSINGKCVCPSKDSPNYEHWVRVDCMVTSWILNSLTNDIIAAFLCTYMAKELWDEFQERLDESNRPLIYKLQREISSISRRILLSFNILRSLKNCGTNLITVNLFLIAHEGLLSHFGYKIL